MKFTLLSAEYLCTPKNTAKFCSGTKLSYQEVIWYFQIFFLSFAKQGHTSYQFYVNFASLQRQNPSEYST